MPRKGHHPECGKEWWTVFDDLVPPSDCPTCKALRSDILVYEFPILERMYAGEGWTAQPVDEATYETAD